MKQKPPSIVPVLVLTLITVTTWVFFTIYRALTSKPAPIVAVQISEPLDPSLDQKAIDAVSGRLFLDESQIPATTFSSSLTGSTPAPTSVATSSATPVPTTQATNAATQSGILTQ